jgi:hypothetical protein
LKSSGPGSRSLASRARHRRNDTRRRRAELRAVAHRRAAAAYKNEGTKLDPLFDAKDPSEGSRSTALLDRANEVDNPTLADLAALNAELAADLAAFLSAPELAAVTGR